MRSILPHAENPALREIAREIAPSEITSPHIQSLIADMKQLLAKEKYGVALAAPQVGEPLRLFIVAGSALKKRASKKDHEMAEEIAPESSEAETASEDMVCINPVMTKVSKDTKNKHEGCLSVRGYWGRVARAEKATIRAYDEHGNLFTRGASGFLAHIFQHEMDHLEGILYTDKAVEIYEDNAEEA